MKPVPFALKRCDLVGCEKQAGFVLGDGRYICPVHAMLFTAGQERQQSYEEFLEKQQPDLLEELEEGKYLPGDEENGLKPQR
jgi:hypothetical protein